MPLLLLFIASLIFFGCGGTHSEGPRRTVSLDLDSLNRVQSHDDSVESNHYFYQQAFAAYVQRFPGTDKRGWERVAKGKDQEFCLFKPNPAASCLEVADKMNDLGLKPAARDAYEAGLVSEQYNEPQQNVRLWGSMGQIAREDGDIDGARLYFTKILAQEPKNKWAKKQLASLRERVSLSPD